MAYVISLSCRKNMGGSKNFGPVLGALRMEHTVYWGLFWGPSCVETPNLSALGLGKALTW